MKKIALIMISLAVTSAVCASGPARHPSFKPIEIPPAAHSENLLLNAKATASGHIVQIEGYASPPVSALGGGIGTIDTRYPPFGPVDGLQPPAQGIPLVAWRGERVSAHVVLASDATHQALRFDSLRLAHAAGDSSIAGSARFVRYTLADGVPQGDILDPASTLDLPAGSNRPVWIEINVPRDAAPGDYHGTLTVRSNSSTIEFPINLEVLPATLPPHPNGKSTSTSGSTHTPSPAGTTSPSGPTNTSPCSDRR